MDETRNINVVVVPATPPKNSRWVFNPGDAAGHLESIRVEDGNTYTILFNLIRGTNATPNDVSFSENPSPIQFTRSPGKGNGAPPQNPGEPEDPHNPPAQAHEPPWKAVGKTGANGPTVTRVSDTQVELFIDAASVPGPAYNALHYYKINVKEAQGPLHSYDPEIEEDYYGGQKPSATAKATSRRTGSVAK